MIRLGKTFNARCNFKIFKVFPQNGESSNYNFSKQSLRNLLQNLKHYFDFDKKIEKASKIMYFKLFPFGNILIGIRK